VPDGAAGEAVHDLDTQVGGGARGGLHLSGGAGADAFRVAVPPHVRGKDSTVAFVDGIAHGLADQVVADGPHPEAVGIQQLAAVGAVAPVGGGARDVEVVAPTGEFEAVVAPGARLRGQLGQRHVGPLAGEEGDGPGQASASVPNRSAASRVSRTSSQVVV